MPAIQIKESAPYHLINGALSEQLLAAKYLVAQAITLDPSLSIAETKQDNSYGYDVILRVANTNIGFEVSYLNSENRFRLLAGAWLTDGTFNVTTQNYASNFFVAGSSGTDVKVVTAGVDGVLKQICFLSSRSADAPIFKYGFFTSDTSQGRVCVFDFGLYQRSAWPNAPIMDVCSDLPGRYYNSDLDIIERIYYTGHTNVNAWCNAGYRYAFTPRGFEAFTDSKSFANIKWGGAYNLYNLLNSDGSIVKTDFGDTVRVNGVNMLSAGVVGLIE